MESGLYPLVASIAAYLSKYAAQLASCTVLADPHADVVSFALVARPIAFVFVCIVVFAHGMGLVGVMGEEVWRDGGSGNAYGTPDG